MLLSCCSTEAASVRWLRNDLPPLYIVQGPSAGTGIVDKVIQFLTEKLPHHNMSSVYMNPKRFWFEVEQNQNYCRADAFKTAKRQQIAIFSIPFYFVPPVQIVMHHLDWQALGEPRSMKLSSLLQDNRYHGVITDKASYGKTIDELFRQYEDRSKVNFTRETISPQSLFSMINVRRIDYTVENTMFLDRYLATAENTDLKKIKIEEESNFYTVHIACTKNPWGTLVMADFNHVLKRHRMSEDFLDSLRRDGKLLYEEFYFHHLEEFSTIK